MSNTQAFFSWKAGAKVADITIQSKYIQLFFERKIKKTTNDLISRSNQRQRKRLKKKRREKDSIIYIRARQKQRKGDLRGKFKGRCEDSVSKQGKRKRS